MGTVISLTTDFGLSDGYVAAMKGVILKINPEARLVDISHRVNPGDIMQGAFVLATTCGFFPDGAVHLAVVDPGVGTDRRAIILKTPAACFVAPDNGLLSYVLDSYYSDDFASEQAQVEIRPPLEAVAIMNPKYRLSPVSATFHGRDIFAPAAAHLSLGTPLQDFGDVINTLAVCPPGRPQRGPDGLLMGSIIHIDNFGNLVTSFRSEDLGGPEGFSVAIGGRSITSFRRTYAEGEGLLALAGSSGYLEIALKGGSAARFLNVRVGERVKVKQVE